MKRNQDEQNKNQKKFNEETYRIFGSIDLDLFRSAVKKLMEEENAKKNKKDKPP